MSNKGANVFGIRWEILDILLINLEVKPELISFNFSTSLFLKALGLGNLITGRQFELVVI